MAGSDGIPMEGLTPPPLPLAEGAGKVLGPAAPEVRSQVGALGKPSSGEAPTQGQAFVDRVVEEGGAREIPNTNPPEVTVSVGNVKPLMETLASGQEPIRALGSVGVQPAQPEVIQEPRVVDGEVDGFSVRSVDGPGVRGESMALVPFDPLTEGINSGLQGQIIDVTDTVKEPQYQVYYGSQHAAPGPGVITGEVVAPGGVGDGSQAKEQTPTAEAINNDYGSGKTSDNTDKGLENPTNPDAAISAAGVTADKANQSSEPPPQTPDVPKGTSQPTPDIVGGMAPRPDSQPDNSTGEPNPTEAHSEPDAKTADTSSQKSPELDAAEKAQQAIRDSLYESNKADIEALQKKIEQSKAEGLNTLAELQNSDLERAQARIDYQAFLKLAEEDPEKATHLAKNGDLDAAKANAKLQVNIIDAQEGVLNRQSGGFLSRKTTRAQDMEEWAKAVDKWGRFDNDPESEKNAARAAGELERLKTQTKAEIIQGLIKNGATDEEIKRLMTDPGLKLQLKDHEGKIINQHPQDYKARAQELSLYGKDDPDAKKEKRKLRKARPTWEGAWAQLKADKEMIKEAEKKLADIKSGKQVADKVDIVKLEEKIKAAQIESKDMRKIIRRIFLRNAFLGWLAAGVIIVLGGTFLGINIAGKWLGGAK